MKNIKITLKRHELLADIEEIAYITAETMIGVDDQTKNTIKDITQDGRIGRITTLANSAWGELLHTISGYTKQEATDHASVTDEYMDIENYNVLICVSNNFNAMSTQAVTRTMHDFMINRILGRYFSIAKKDEANTFMYLSDRNLIDIKKYLFSSIEKTRRPISIF